MKILQLAPPWFAVPPVGYGGIERVVSLLADGLVDEGHDVTLLASGGSRTKGRLWTVFDEPPSLQLGSAFHDLRHAVEGYRWRYLFDIIHDHSGPSGLALGAMLDGPPVVHTLHGPWTPEMESLCAALHPALHFVAISRDQAARAPAGVRVADVIHNGIPVVQFPFRSDPRGRDGYIAFVGRASREKGPDVAVRVARRLGRRLRMAVKINEESERVYWRRAVEPLLDGAQVDVVINGSAALAADLMAGADATLCPIQWDEPFGLVMAESMACGTPVVGYASGALPEVIEHNVTGFCVPRGDEDGLCDALDRVSEIDPRACRERVVEQFSAAAMVRRYATLFDDLYRGGPERIRRTGTEDPLEVGAALSAAWAAGSAGG